MATVLRLYYQKTSVMKAGCLCLLVFLLVSNVAANESGHAGVTTSDEGIARGSPGNALLVWCRAASSPTSAVRWFRGHGRYITAISDDDALFELRGPELRILQLKNATVGPYECQAFGDGRAAMWRVLVQADEPLTPSLSESPALSSEPPAPSSQPRAASTAPSTGPEPRNSISSVCTLEMDRGPCKNYSVSWYYDTEYGGCSRLWYGGCEGNGNRFSTKEECEDTCVSPPLKEACKLPKIRGACRGFMHRWYYDTARKMCSQFIYGGCLGNANNFETRDLCQAQCESGSLKESGHSGRQKRQSSNAFVSSSFVILGGKGSGWGQWGEISPCSRTCGGGVASQKRICLQLGPDGSPHCTGGDTKYFSCMTQDCPAGSRDFREQQCSHFDNDVFENATYRWVSYKQAPNPCELNCMPRGKRFYYRHRPKVVDGTRCNDESFDVCVNGTCQAVGCDKMLGSNAREDKCRECRGSGVNCETVTGVLDAQDLKKEYLRACGACRVTPGQVPGYNDLLLIPEGATNIDIKERAPSNNYLALRAQNNTLYLSGNYQIETSGRLVIQGTMWHYDRGPRGIAAPEKLRCLGPTNVPLYLAILLKEDNVGVEYEYSVPKDRSPSSNTEYKGTREVNSPCKTCAGEESGASEAGVVRGVPGYAVVVRCRAASSPPPAVRWFRGHGRNITLISDDDELFEVRGHELRILQLTNATVGPYECQASGDGRAGMWRVLVRTAPPSASEPGAAPAASAAAESRNATSTDTAPETCVDYPHLANCTIIVKARFCHHKYYATWCCKSCEQLSSILK